MEPWFIWHDIDSRTMGVWVSELPAPTRAAERTEEVTIPGRAGTLTLKEGVNVHEGYVKECKITVRADADIASLLDWLTGDGQVIFSNEPDRSYFAHLAAEVRFDRQGNTLKTATIPFYVHPHKAQYPPETDITLTTSGSVYNPGSVASMPLITVTFTEEAEIEIGDDAMTLTAADPGEGESYAQETVIIDCGAEIITKKGEIWDGSSTGAFPRIAPGSNTITLTDCTCVIKPRWRWY